MSFHCKNGIPHKHETAEESRACWNAALIQRTQATRIQPTQPRPITHSVPLTGAGSTAYHSGSKLLKFLPMLDQVEPGYYAVEPGDGSDLTFWRISRPTRTDAKYRDCTVIQRVSSDDLVRGAIVHPPTQWSPGRRVTVYDTRTEDAMLLVICDPRGCAFRYSQEIGKCGRCNKQLTSEWRKVGIGPECVKHWPWMLEMHNERQAQGQ